MTSDSRGRSIRGDTMTAICYRALKAHAVNRWLSGHDLLLLMPGATNVSTWVSCVRLAHDTPAGESVPPCKMIGGRRHYMLVVNGKAGQGEMFGGEAK